MFKYVIKRILLMLLMLFIILSLCFILIKLLPLPPVNGDEVTVQRVEARRQAMGYYEPIMVQLWLFWKRIITSFDWGYGENIYPAYRVVDVIAEKLPATLMVNLYALVFSVPIGVLLGIVAAIKKNKWQDHLISTLVMVVISVPSFVYAVLLQYLLAYKWGLFPAHADIGNNWVSPEGFYSLIIPILALSFGTIAGFTRYTRAELSEVLTSDYLLLARTKGLTRRQATIRHALRNAMVVIFPMILGEFISVLSGSLVIESIFTIPGIGALYVQSIQAQDYNFFMAISAFYTTIGLVAGIVIDLSYGLIDPRIRMGAK
jgi:oligopeptide transport system permease protein